MDLVRWILIIPATILSVLAFFLLNALLINLLIDENELGKYFYVVSAFISTASAIIWLYVSQKVAPNFKKISIWVSYFIGTCFVFGICYLIYDEGKSVEIEILVSSIALPGIIGGFIYCFYYQIKNTSKRSKKELFNLIDENIF